jgi:RimJ/RimL family protein N-acetyltransferase
MLNLTPTLSDDVIGLSPLCADDFEALYTVAGDKDLWAGHPNKDRYQRAEFEAWFAAAMASDGVLKITDLKTQSVIGSSRYYEYQAPEREVAVGYTFLARAYWGGPTNRRLKSLMFNHAFEYVNRIWLHIGAENTRSQRAAEKIGAVRSHIEHKQLSGDTQQYVYYYVDKPGDSSPWHPEINQD